MKKLLTTIALAITALAISANVQAATRTYTERECSTDSYGNTTCRDKTTNVETGVITYSNHTVNGYATGGVVTTGQQIRILNTAVPSGVSLAATIIVALGGLSMGLKVLLRHLS